MGARTFFRDYLGFMLGPCKPWGRHKWKDDGDFKRTCTRCRRHEWLVSKPYPSVGEPAMSWRDMGYVPASLPNSGGQ